MRVERSIDIKADRFDVWSVLSDPKRYPDFMPRLERWEPASEDEPGVGSRFTVHWKIGAAPMGGVIELVEFDTGRDLAWLSITGVGQRGRFRLRNAGRGATKVTFRLSYQSPGGLMGVVADWLASRQVGHELEASLAALREQVQV